MFAYTENMLSKSTRNSSRMVVENGGRKYFRSDS